MTMKITKSISWVIIVVVVVVDSFMYQDQKQNCSKRVNDNYCYNGPRFDNVGQYKSCSVPGTVALTFDDGVDMNIPYVLAMLRLFNMKGTFFLVGQNIQLYPWLVQHIVDSGNQVGWHSYSHAWFSKLTYESALQDFYDFENAFLQNRFTGVLQNRMVPSYGRLPHGLLPSSMLPLFKMFDVVPIHWSFLSGDSYVTNSSEIVEVFKSHLKGAIGALLSIIVQQHEMETVTMDSLYDVLSYLNSTFPKVRFTTVAECVGNIVPMYHESKYHQEDPLCLTGLKKTQSGKNVCCQASCAKSLDCNGANCCGGTSCSSRPGGGEGCCANNIILRNISCSMSRPPCIVYN